MAPIPDFVSGNVIVTEYSGKDSQSSPSIAGGIEYRTAPAWDDLQSAGLTGPQMQQDFASLDRMFANPAAPTAAELRRLAIHTNYRGLMDVSAGGGFDLLFGKALTGKVYGREYLALARAEAGDAAVTLMTQIPADFDIAHPLIITGPSSGSRGVYGAVSIAEWAFRNKGAVAYTDKGGGPGAHDLDRDIVYTVDGLPVPASQAGDAALFRVPGNDDLAAFKTAFPNRLGLKHAHSQKNPERNWGRYVLLSIEFAFFCLNHYKSAPDGSPFTRPGTRVIAAGISNGGGSALKAAEQDDPDHPLIDAVVVSEPQVQPEKGAPKDAFVINDRGTIFTGHSRSLLDISTLMDIYAPSAAFVIDGQSDPTGPVQQGRLRRSQLLHERGLLKSADPLAQGHEALDIIHANGLLHDADRLLPFHQWAGFWRLLAMTYTNAHGRASVSDHVCGVSAAALDGRGLPAAPGPQLTAQMCGWGSGLGFLSPVGSVAYVDATPLPDFNLGAALCFRSLVTGTPCMGQAPVGAQWITARRVQAGMAEVRATGRLRGKPTLILHGRSDALIAPNHSSRPYYALNKLRDGPGSPTRYIEVVNGNHFDFFIPTLGAKTLVPMHFYLDQALDLMHRHLSDPTAHPLPESQVVPAKADSKPWTADNWRGDLPGIALTVTDENRITFDNGVLAIPEGRPHADA